MLWILEASMHSLIAILADSTAHSTLQIHIRCYEFSERDRIESEAQVTHVAENSRVQWYTHRALDSASCSFQFVGFEQIWGIIQAAIQAVPLLRRRKDEQEISKKCSVCISC